MPHFQAHRNKRYEGESEYFSSNCIKVGDKVSAAGAGLLQGQSFVFGTLTMICMFTVVCHPTLALTTCAIVVVIFIQGFASLRFSLSSIEPTTGPVLGQRARSRNYW